MVPETSSVTLVTDQMAVIIHQKEQEGMLHLEMVLLIPDQGIKLDLGIMMTDQEPVIVGLEIHLMAGTTVETDITEKKALQGMVIKIVFKADLLPEGVRSPTLGREVLQGILIVPGREIGLRALSY